MCKENHEITGLLMASRDGDEGAFDQLMSLVYNDLRRIAHNQLRRSQLGETMSTTVLVNEAYVKLVGHSVAWQDRSHFFAIAARAMRQIIVDYAKRQSRKKRGCNRRCTVNLDEMQLAVESDTERIIALDQALGKLSAIDERLTRVVECRYFAGYSERETADALSLSLSTVQRSWSRARTWLKRYLMAPAGEAGVA